MKPPIFHDIPAPGLPNFKLPVKLILLVPLALLLLITLFSGYFTVDTESVAVVQRFGKFQRIAEPGLHFKLPLGIDQATVIRSAANSNSSLALALPMPPTPIKSAPNRNWSATWLPAI